MYHSDYSESQIAVEIKSMKEKLEALEWKLYYECSRCNGQKQYFTNPAKPKYEIRTRPKNQTFSILYENHVIAGPFYGYQLGEKLSKYVQ